MKVAKTVVRGILRIRKAVKTKKRDFLQHLFGLNRAFNEKKKI